MNSTAAVSDPALWLREFGFSEGDERIERRVKAAAAIAQDFKVSELESLINLAFGQKLPADNGLVQRVLRVCTESDPEFPNYDNQRQLAVIAGMALAQNIFNSQATDISAVSALAVITASAFGSRKLNLPVDIVQLALDSMRVSSEDSRRRPDLSKAASSIANEKFPGAPTIAAIDAAAVTNAMGEMATAIKAYTTRVVRRFTESLTATDRYLRQQDDELQMLWWLVGNRSWLLNRPFSEVPAVACVVTAAEELASATSILPGPQSIDALFYRAGISDSDTVPVTEYISSIPIDILQQVVPTGSFSPILSPLHFAMERQLENGVGNHWVNAWANVTGLPVSVSSDRLGLAIQIYRERILIDALARANA